MRLATGSLERRSARGEAALQRFHLHADLLQLGTHALLDLEKQHALFFAGVLLLFWWMLS
jgi:hypothetical protein